MTRPILIGITGSISSGKSVACKMIEQRGFQVLYTDDIGHSVLEQIDVIELLVNEFGDNIALDGKIDRKEMGRIVFSDKKKLAYLNSVIHPRINSILQNYVDNSSKEYLFFEVPLLFEVGMEVMFDYILTISVSEEVQEQRLMNRNAISLNDAKLLIAKQIPNNVKEKKSDYVIMNNQTTKELQRKIDIFLGCLPKIVKKDIQSFV